MGMKILTTLMAIVLFVSCGGKDSDSGKSTQIESMHFEQQQYTLSAGGSFTPNIYIKFRTMNEEVLYDRSSKALRITWTVADPSIATVSNEGVLTYVKKGTTTLTASIATYNIKITATINAIDGADWHGDWVLTSWNSAADLSQKVYINLGENGSFALYQLINTTQGYAHFSGTYTYNEQILSGLYSDRTPWSQSYTAVVSETSLTLTGQSDGNIGVYTRTTIPDYVKESAPAVSPRSVRSKEITPFL